MDIPYLEMDFLNGKLFFHFRVSFPMGLQRMMVGFTMFCLMFEPKFSTSLDIDIFCIIMLIFWSWLCPTLGRGPTVTLPNYYRYL